MKKHWNKLEIAWLILGVFIVIGAIIYKHLIIRDFTADLFFVLASDISAICGVIYVIGIAKQEKTAYIFGMANVLLYALVVYNKGLYLSATYNLFYSFPIYIYGYMYWSKLENKEDSGVKEFSTKQRILLVIGIIALVSAFAFISNNLLGGNNAIVDSIVSVLVCVATFLVAKKYIEQWVLFMISNFMGIILFLPNGTHGMESIDLLAMWSVYFINSIYGYFAWKSGTKKEIENA